MELVFSLAVGLLLGGVVALRVRTVKLESQLRSQQEAKTALEESVTSLGERCAQLDRVKTRNAAILQHAMDGFFALDETCRFVEVNDAFCRMLGYTRDELLKLRMSDIEVPGSGAAFLGERSLRSGLHHFPTNHRRRDGQIIQLESSVVVVRDGERKILTGFARDTTERVRAEEALRQSEEQYRRVVEMSRDLIFSVDSAGRWKFVNSAARRIYGYDAAEMIGRPMRNFISPERVERDASHWAALRAGRQAYLRFSTIHVRKDGRPIHLEFHAIAVRDAMGQFVELMGTASDVTEQRQAAEELRASNERFEAIRARMPLGYIVWGRDRSVLEWNSTAEVIFGYAATEALSARTLERIIPPSSRAAFDDAWARMLAGEPHSTLLLTARRKDEESIKCEWFNTVLHDALGQVQCIASIVRDVSERERLEARLQYAQKLESLGVLAGGVAHDFNNILGIILGNATLALERLAEDSPGRGPLMNVAKACQRATELTRHMLAYAGRAECRAAPVDVNALIDEMTDLMRAAIPRSIQLEIDLEPGLPLVEADSGQLQQVLMNLLINAAESIDGAGRIAISTQIRLIDDESTVREFSEEQLAPGEYVMVEVVDTGCGMTPQTLARIFEPFFTTKFTGRGLGLSAIRGILNAHGGGIRVRSRLEAGSSFAFVLPVSRDAHSAVNESDGVYSIPSGATVLVVDDEEEIRDIVQAVLENRGVRVLTAADGRHGVDLFRQSADQIDIVLLDMTMPGLSGEEVYREIAALRPDVRVIVSSGFSEQETVSRFNGARLAGFVPKPYTADALVDKIGRALAEA